MFAKASDGDGIAKKLIQSEMGEKKNSSSCPDKTTNFYEFKE